MFKFAEPVCYGRLVKRYKRFFMDVELDDKRVVTAHTPNTGSMKGLLASKNLVMLTKNSDPKRKTAYSTQAIKVGEHFVGINTHIPNALVEQSLDHELLREFHGYQSVKREVKYGPDMRSRIDLFFSNHQNNVAPFYLEIKNVTLKIDEQAQFPDAVSTRAQKHIEDLLYIKNNGFNAGLLFIIQRCDCKSFSPAKNIDPHYAKLLYGAKKNGLIIKALSAKVTENGVSLDQELPVEL